MKVPISIYVSDDNYTLCSSACPFLDSNFEGEYCTLFDEQLFNRDRCSRCKNFVGEV